MEVRFIRDKICKDHLKDLLGDECEKAKREGGDLNIDLVLTKGKLQPEIIAEEEEKQHQVTFSELFECIYKLQKGTREFVDNRTKNICAWTEAIEEHTDTRTHIYGFGIRVPASRLIITSVTFEFVCGLTVTPHPLNPMFELEGYRDWLPMSRT
ncbi:Uncharacterized protein TCM_014290 [Theobroma cacao]|uniref:Uncharacterized protein n=1 Tax=Theobroma cacao TaxID=3641 RepID=A0A061FX44_THECC|nr:Uncharacterized protein TCM_014290 [Theobroma cacao]